MNRRLSPIVMMCCTLGLSQSIDLDRLGQVKWFRYNGGVAANAVYYDGTANRQDLTYYLTGNHNFNLGGVYSLPLSFTYSNQEFAFPNPFKFNRLSLHPSYKWSTAHIGDVSMTFSPYTLAGHQFTGVGFDLNPKGKFQISAMYGRLLRATEYNTEEPQAITAYRRVRFEKGNVSIKIFSFANNALIDAVEERGESAYSIPFDLSAMPTGVYAVLLETPFGSTLRKVILK